MSNEMCVCVCVCMCAKILNLIVIDKREQWLSINQNIVANMHWHEHWDRCSDCVEQAIQERERGTSTMIKINYSRWHVYTLMKVWTLISRYTDSVIIIGNRHEMAWSRIWKANATQVDTGPSINSAKWNRLSYSVDGGGQTPLIRADWLETLSLNMFVVTQW